ncbi:MAG: DNA-binding protein [Nitrospirae bacterium GWD2_57_9]|nr:MAG: DNA-binding protein [Nitrospirae bacterium GWD2_57_9]
MSPRCKKPRNCQCKFRGKAFKPTGIPMSEVKQMLLSRDELEALKLCDLDDLTQEEAGEKMGVSRGTIQRILAAARKKVAQALTRGQAIVFE